MRKPKICLVLSGPSMEQNKELLEKYRPWIDMAELRADKIPVSEWDQLNDFSTKAGLELILTLRNINDGGNWNGTTEEKERFFTHALDGEWSYFDLEADHKMISLENVWLSKGRRVILSFHDFQTVPKNLAARIKKLLRPGIVVKAAVYPKSSQEYLDFINQVLSIPSGEKVVLAMGPYGFSSRLLASRLNSAWSYTSDKDADLAPGMTDPQTLKMLYRFSEQTPKSPVFGIIGNPVFHSQSPLIHNFGLRKLGLPGVYVPFLVDDLPAFFETTKLLGIQGLSVTIPFKEKIIPFLSKVAPAVRAIGACNTLVRQKDGTWYGDNTDALGFLIPLTKIWGNDLSERKVAVIGTGGAAHGVVWALRESGAKVLILGRTPEKAQTLALATGSEWAPLGIESEPLLREYNDLIVQTTNVGMGSQAGMNPLDWYTWQGKEIAYDIIYTPEKTPFLEAAEKTDCTLIFGKEMLNHQAYAQFRHFTGKEYPLNQEE